MSYTIEIEATTPLEQSQNEMATLVRLIGELKISADIKEFRFQKRPDGDYDYKFQAVDGRT